MVEIKYGLAPAFWGRGYVPEGTRAVQEWGVERWGVRRFIGVTEGGNERSAGVLKKLGYVEKEVSSWKRDRWRELMIKTAERHLYRGRAGARVGAGGREGGDGIEQWDPTITGSYLLHCDASKINSAPRQVRFPVLLRCTHCRRRNAC